MLTPFAFLLHNKRKTGMIATILIVAVFCISFITTIINSVQYTCKKVNVSPFLSFSIIRCPDNYDYISTHTIELIKEREQVGEAYNTIITNVSIDTVFGTTSSSLFFINQEEKLSSAIDCLKLSLKEGRLPVSGQLEIILHERVLTNKKLSVGDKIGDYTIVGTLIGDAQVNFGSCHKNLKNFLQTGIADEFALSLLVIPKNGNLKEMNTDLKKLEFKDAQVYSKEDARNKLEDEFNTINMILLLIIIMVSISLSIAVAALAHSFYSNRYDEFGILYAMGYEKHKIQLLIFEEILILIVFGWGIGYGLSLVGLSMFDTLIYDKMGQDMQIFVIDSLLYASMIPLLVLISTLLPVAVKLQKSDLICIVERR